MNKEVLTLAQFLKANDYVSSGGQAKYFLKEYTVKVNQIETNERGKKLYPNDIVLIGDDEYILKYD